MLDSTYTENENERKERQMFEIDHGDTIDLCDLTALAVEANGYLDLEPDEQDPVDAAEARHVLDVLLTFVRELATPGATLDTVEHDLGEIEDRAGTALIADSHLDGDYAYRLYVETCGDPEIEGKLREWPLDCIDWTDAAKDLRHDYTPVSLEGSDYLLVYS